MYRRLRSSIEITSLSRRFAVSSRFHRIWRVECAHRDANRCTGRSDRRRQASVLLCLQG